MESFVKHNFNVVKIRFVGFIRSGEGTPVHIDRPSHGVVLYIGGGCCFDFEGQKLYTKKNTLIYLPKHSDYTVKTVKPEPGITCYAINFDLTEQIDFPPFVHNVKNASALFRLFKQTEFAWRTKKPCFEMECKANLYHILCALRQEFELGYIAPSTARSLEPAISYIHQNYTNENITIEHLSKICKMSETYFRTVFKKVKGTSPLKYVNDLKLTRAKELLGSNMYSVREVSRLAGFHDEAYFSREFKKAIGCCPSKYREEGASQKHSQ